MRILKMVYIIRFNAYKTQNHVIKSHTKSSTLKELFYTLISNLFKTDSIVNNSRNILLTLNYLLLPL